jgi:hypothetical protein
MWRVLMIYSDDDLEVGKIRGWAGSVAKLYCYALWLSQCGLVGV